MTLIAMGSTTVKRARKGADSEYYYLEATPAIIHLDKKDYTDDVISVRMWHIKGSAKEEVTGESVTVRCMTAKGESQDLAWSSHLPLSIGYSDIDDGINDAVSFVIDGILGASALNIPVVRDGKDVTVVATEVVYQEGTSPTAPPDGVWDVSVPAVNEGNYLWTRTTIKLSDGSNTVTYSVSRQGMNGVAGVPGCTQRVFKEYMATEQTSSGNSVAMVYHNDAAEDGSYSAIRFIDIMCIRNDSNTSGYDVYMCKRTHSAAATWAEDYTPENWEEVSFNSVSAFFLNLIAKNATIEMLSSSCIAIMDKDNPGIRKTGMSNPVDDNQPAIWAGATSNSDLTTAPFYVTNTGYLHSTSGYFRDVTITGYLGGDNGWEVTADEIKNRTSILPKITLYKDGTQFMVLGETESMLSVRNDNGNGISILTQAHGSTGLNITAQNGAYAINSYGTINMYSRGSEHTMINSLVLGAAQASENVGMSSCSQNTSFDDTGFTGQPVAVLFTRSTTNEITVTLPSSPKIGQIAIVVQCTDKKVYINGNGKRFYHGSTYTVGMANSNTNGQWNVFVYDGSGWQSVYIQGTPF